jgi:serine/threonine-protein kinase
MSPEQTLGEFVTPASDLFCLGLCLYELATGRHPFASPSVRDVQKGIRSTPLPKLAQRRSDLPGEWIALVEQLMEKDPNRRPTATDVARLLAEMARQEKKH